MQSATVVPVWLLVQFSRPVEGLGLSPVSGGFSEGDTPLPIPNREVKPLSADGTWLARAWESRSPPINSHGPSLGAARSALGRLRVGALRLGRDVDDCNRPDRRGGRAAAPAVRRLRGHAPAGGAAGLLAEYRERGSRPRAGARGGSRLGPRDPQAGVRGRAAVGAPRRRLRGDRPRAGRRPAGRGRGRRAPRGPRAGRPRARDPGPPRGRRLAGRAGRVGAVPDRAELLPCFTPENQLEDAVTGDPELLGGLAWGEPRHGHPEGAVAQHVCDLLEE